MQFFDMRFGDFVCRMINDIIHTAEVVYSLHDIINTCILSSNAQCVGLEDIARLFFGQATALYVVGVVGKVYLRTVIDTAF